MTKDIVTKNTTEVVSAIATFLLDDSGADFKTPFKEYLKVDRLDYSVESLKIIDKYLQSVRDIIKDKNGKKVVLTKYFDEYKTIVLRCGAYVGEVFRHNSMSQLKWIIYDEAIKLDHIIKDFGKSEFTFYILYEPKRLSFLFPMDKIAKFLDAGESESIYFYANAILRRLNRPSQTMSIIGLVLVLLSPISGFFLSIVSPSIIKKYYMLLLIPLVIGLWIFGYLGIRNNQLYTFTGKKAKYISILFVLFGVYILSIIINLLINPKNLVLIPSKPIFGIFFILFGILGLIAKLFKIKSIFSYRESYHYIAGKPVGELLHTLRYIVVPIALGLLLIFGR